MNNISDDAALIIPAYEPDEALVKLIEDLTEYGLYNIIVVDDGSGDKYKHIFDRVSAISSCTLLTHEVNKGKGRALKNAFAWVLDNLPDVKGVVTADSDGQHTPEDIYACMEALVSNPDALILGVRRFDTGDVPAKSLAGNRITSFVFRLFMGLKISDTQTGLRGIGRDFMKTLLDVDGERYEFETNMLIETKRYGVPIVEVPIRTVYIADNSGSHFRPVRDSIRIYYLILKYTLSSGISSIVDLSLFTILCAAFRGKAEGFDYIFAATAIARVVSATLNYFINLRVVFATGVSVKNSIWKYALLALVSLCLSGLLVRFIYPHFGGLEIFVKLPVDILIFFMNYVVQREIVFKVKKNR